MKALYAERGDTFFTQSNSLLGRLIRWGETDPGETNGTWANHTGVVVESGWIGNPKIPGYKEAVVVEALWKTRRGPLKLNGIEVRVFRPVPQYTEEEKQRFVVEAAKYVGDTYGWWKLIFQLGDRALFKGRKVLSLLLFVDKRPICSYLAAKVNEMARPRIMHAFGMEPQTADPDEMLDYCEANPQFWEEVK